jgi:hypothetical protein
MDEDAALAAVRALLMPILNEVAGGAAEQQLFICSGRGDPDHGIVRVFAVRKEPRGSRERLPAIVFGCPDCGRRVPFGSRRMSQIGAAVKDGRLDHPVDISFC